MSKKEGQQKEIINRSPSPSNDTPFIDQQINLNLSQITPIEANRYSGNQIHSTCLNTRQNSISNNLSIYSNGATIETQNFKDSLACSMAKMCQCSNLQCLGCQNARGSMGSISVSRANSIGGGPMYKSHSYSLKQKPMISKKYLEDQHDRKSVSIYKRKLGTGIIKDKRYKRITPNSFDGGRRMKKKQLENSISPKSSLCQHERDTEKCFDFQILQNISDRKLVDILTSSHDEVNKNFKQNAVNQGEESALNELAKQIFLQIRSQKKQDQILRDSLETTKSFQQQTDVKKQINLQNYTSVGFKSKNQQQTSKIQNQLASNQTVSRQAYASNDVERWNQQKIIMNQNHVKQIVKPKIKSSKSSKELQSKHLSSNINQLSKFDQSRNQNNIQDNCKQQMVYEFETNKENRSQNGANEINKVLKNILSTENDDINLYNTQQNHQINGQQDNNFENMTLNKFNTIGTKSFQNVVIDFEKDRLQKKQIQEQNSSQIKQNIFSLLNGQNSQGTHQQQKQIHNVTNVTEQSQTNLPFNSKNTTSRGYQTNHQQNQAQMTYISQTQDSRLDEENFILSEFTDQQHSINRGSYQHPMLTSFVNLTFNNGNNGGHSNRFAEQQLTSIQSGFSGGPIHTFGDMKLGKQTSQTLSSVHTQNSRAKLM